MVMCPRCHGDVAPPLDVHLQWCEAARPQDTGPLPRDDRRSYYQTGTTDPRLINIPDLVCEYCDALAVAAAPQRDPAGRPVIYRLVCVNHLFGWTDPTEPEWGITLYPAVLLGSGRRVHPQYLKGARRSPIATI